MSEIPRDILPYPERNQSDSNLPLFSYFFSDDGMKIIRQWGIQCRSTPGEALCFLVSLIFRLSGHQIEISVAHLESESYEVVMQEYHDSTECSDFNPPVLSLMKEKKDRFSLFWEEISSQILSSNIAFHSIFSCFMKWISMFNMCKARILRQTSLYLSISLFLSLGNSLFRINKDLSKLIDIEVKSDIIKDQISAFQTEEKHFLSLAKSICRNSLFKSIRDTEAKIRSMTTIGLCKGILNCPFHFCEDLYLSYIGWAFHDPVPKNRASALVSFLPIIESNLNNSHLLSFLEKNEAYIVSLCGENENKLVEASLKLIILLFKNKVLKSQDLTIVFDLVYDSNQSIRSIASEFVGLYKFGSIFEEDEQLKLLLVFLKEFESDMIPNVISSLRPNIRCLNNWKLICEMLLGINDDDNSRLLSSILLYSVESVSGKISGFDPDLAALRSLSLSLVSYLPSIIAAFQTDPFVQLQVIKASRVLDLSAISEFASDQMFLRLLSEIRDCFLNSHNPDVYHTAISVLYELSTGKHQLCEIARSELNKLAVGCSHILDGTRESVGKFLAACKFVDMCDNTEARIELMKMVKSSDESISSDSIQCLSYFFQWDVTHLKGNNDGIRSYFPRYSELFELFYSQISHHSFRVKLSVLNSLSSMIALSTFFVGFDTNAIFNSSFYDSFFLSFHECMPNAEIFSIVSKLITWFIIPQVYATHLMVYFFNDEYKSEINCIWGALKHKSPIPGKEVFSSLRSIRNKTTYEGLLNISKFICKKFKSYDVLERWFSLGEDDRFLQFMIPFLSQINPNESKNLKKISSPRFHRIFEQIETEGKISQSSIGFLKKTHDNGSNHQSSDEPDGSFSRY